MEPINRSQRRVAHAPDRDSAEIVDIAEMRCDDTRLVLCILNQRAERKRAWDGEEPGRVGDEHAQEGEQGMFVLMAEAGETTA